MALGPHAFGLVHSSTSNLKLKLELDNCKKRQIDKLFFSYLDIKLHRRPRIHLCIYKENARVDYSTPHFRRNERIFEDLYIRQYLVNRKKKLLTKVFLKKTKTKRRIKREGKILL